MTRILLILSLLASAVVLNTGCSKKVMYEPAPQPSPPPMAAAPAVYADEMASAAPLNRARVRSFAAVMKKDASRAEPEALAEKTFDDASEPPPPPPDAQKVPVRPPVTPEIKPVKRMITYTGAITTRSSNPDSLLAAAQDLAKSVDGYIEGRYDLTITLRVPSAKFTFVYDSLMKLGEIVSFRKSAEDITDAFRDTEQRIRILQKTIERYVQLLPLVKKEREKIALLKEIERLRERLEMLKIRKKNLSRRAEFATIHFTVEQRSTGYDYYTDDSSGKGFEWIQSLSPFQYEKFGRLLIFPVPDGMVHLKDKKAWSMQSPGGTRVWSGKLRNRPRAPAGFWIDAIRFRLKASFQTCTVDTIGDFHCITCTPFPGSNYSYTISVRAVGNNIHIIQCFYPDAEQVRRYRSAIENILKPEATS